jgi:hypothetical protein
MFAPAMHISHADPSFLSASRALRVARGIDRLEHIQSIGKLQRRAAKSIIMRRAKIVDTIVFL